MNLKKIKKILGIGLVVSLTASGCGTSTASTNSTSATSADSSKESSSKTVTLSKEECFSDRDLDGSYDESSSAVITLNGTSAECDSDAVEISDSTVTIKDEGTYIITGNLSDGMIIVDAEKTDKVQLVLDGVTINSESSAPIYVKQADKVFITTVSDTTNTLSNGGTFTAIDDNNIDAVIFSKEDLTLNGSGSLVITSPAGHGVVSKDALKVASGTYQIDCASSGLNGKDEICIADGTFTITSGKDGIHSENEDDEEDGFIYIAGGTFTISAEGDGISADSILQVDDGTFDITAGGGSENAEKKSSDSWGDFKGGPGGPGGKGGPNGNEDSQDENEDGTDSSQEKMSPPADVGNGEAPSKPDDAQDGEAPSKPDGASDENSDDRPQPPSMSDGDSQTPPELPENADKSAKSDSSENTDTQDETDESGNSKNTDIQDETDDSKNTDDSADASSDTAENTDDTKEDADTSEESDSDSTSMKGLKAGTSLIISDGMFTINSADDSLHSNDSVTGNGGTFQIASGDDAIHADETLDVTAGTINITESYEGLEALNLTISGGDITLVADDDGLNAAGGSDSSGTTGGRDGMFGGGPMSSNSDGTLVISGGKIQITASGDGIDANGTVEITDGYITTTGPTQGDTSVLDYDVSGSITGGTFIGTGAASMPQTFDSSEQGVITTTIDKVDAQSTLELVDSDGNIIITYTPELSYEYIILSSPEILTGETYTLNVNGTQVAEVTAD